MAWRLVTRRRGVRNAAGRQAGRSPTFSRKVPAASRKRSLQANDTCHNPQGGRYRYDTLSIHRQPPSTRRRWKPRRSGGPVAFPAAAGWHIPLTRPQDAVARAMARIQSSEPRYRATQGVRRSSRRCGRSCSLDQRLADRRGAVRSGAGIVPTPSPPQIRAGP